MREEVSKKKRAKSIAYKFLGISSSGKVPSNPYFECRQQRSEAQALIPAPAHQTGRQCNCLSGFAAEESAEKKKAYTRTVSRTAWAIMDRMSGTARQSSLPPHRRLRHRMRS